MLLIPIFSWVLASTLRASLLVLVILLLQRLLRSRLSARWKYAIWTPVLLAILIPAQPLLPHWEWPVANESHTASRVDSAPNVAAGSSPEVDLGFDQQSTPSDTNIGAVQPVEEVVASTVDLARATPANSEVQAFAGEDAEIAFAEAGVAERSKSVDSSGQSRDWRAILAAGWLLGAVCLGVVVWTSYAATLCRIRRRAISVEQVDFARVQSLAKELGLRRTPKIWLSPELKAPAVCGAFRPMLLLNDSFFHVLSRDEADFVLRHELMHIRRGDVFLNTILFGLLSLHWFNPLLWFAFFRAGADREAACDEDVLHTESPARRVAYGKTLLRLEAVLPQSDLCLGFVGMVQKGKRLRERIQFIANPKRMGFSMKSLVLLCMCVTAILGIAKSAEPQSKPKTQQSTLATDERLTEESKGETPQQEPLKFRKVTSLESPGAGLSLARIAVSLDQESVIARILSGDRGGTNGGVQFRRYDVVLQNLDPESPKRTSLGDHYFGFVPNSDLAFVVSWGEGVRFWNTVSHAPTGGYNMPHELREDTTILPAVSPNGKVMVTRSRLDHLQFWNIQTRMPITEEIKQRGLVVSMRFSADGKWFFSRASRALSIRDPQTGDLVVVGEMRHDHYSYAYSADTEQLLTVEKSRDEEHGWRSELVIRGGNAFAERRRIELDGQAQKAAWIDKSHFLVVGRNPDLPPSSNERETLYVVTLTDNKADVRTLLQYNWIREAVVAPDRQHFIARTREQTSCWKVGDWEPVWTKPGDHLVSFGDRDWVLFHNGPLVAYSLADGSELWRGEDVRLCEVFGSKIWTCNDENMEIWQVEPGTGPPKPGDTPAQPRRSNGSQESRKSDASETATVDPKLERLKADQDLAVAWLKKEWMARVEHSEGRITGLVFPGFSNVNDEVFEVVATFPELESFSVVSAQITDSGMKSLATLKNLKKLCLLDTKTFTDEGMKSLAGLKKLEVLDLSSSNVTDAGIESTKGLTNLRSVDLDFTKVTDRSLELLSGNEGLKELQLTATPISDEGMKSLAKFRHLRDLDLQSTNVTDKGLQHLRACRELKHLAVNSTKITKEGAKRFNQTLRSCRIVFAPTDIGG